MAQMGINGQVGSATGPWGAHNHRHQQVDCIVTAGKRSDQARPDPWTGAFRSGVCRPGVHVAAEPSALADLWLGLEAAGPRRRV